MTGYLLIESRDPFESRDCDGFLALSAALAGAGHAVTVLLVQNAVFAARRGARTQALDPARQAGVRICADEFSLRERGIAPDRLAPSVAASPLDLIVDHLEEGRKVLWH